MRNKTTETGWEVIIGTRGFTYLTLMFSITLIGITLTAAARPWKAVLQREREADLLAYGMEIQQAIGAYSTKVKAGRLFPGEVYPQTLEELTRQPNPLLRKVYHDPITRTPFELIRAPTGGVMGVRSRSTIKPIRQHEFPPPVRHFDGMKKYRDWVFQHPNTSGSTFPFAGGPMGIQPGGMSPGIPPQPGPMSSGPAQNLNLPGFQPPEADPSEIPQSAFSSMPQVPLTESPTPPVLPDPTP